MIIVWLILGLASAQVSEQFVETTESAVEAASQVAPSWLKDIRRNVYAEPLGAMVRMILFFILFLLKT